MFGHGLRSNVMEAALMLAYTGGIYHFLSWSDSTRRSDRWVHIFAFAGWFTLGFMTKFIAVIFLPAIVGLAALCVADWRRRLWTDLWRWSVGALAVLLPRCTMVRVRPRRVWRVLLGRYFRHARLRPRTWGAPPRPRATLALLSQRDPAADERRRRCRVGRHRRGSMARRNVRRRWPGGLLIALWCLLPIGILSASLAKLYHYSFPFLPPIALAGAYPLSLLVNLARKLGAKAVWPEWTARRVRYGLVAGL